VRIRINLIGTSGAGKSTVGKHIAERLNIPYIQLDELHWKPNWVESTNEELFPKLEKALSSDQWVLDGNYTKTIPIKWKRAQIVVYLDLPFHIVLYRIIKRSLVRGIKHEELWNGNKETVWKHLFTRDSMILWTIKYFHKNRKLYTAIFEKPEYSHIKFVRLRSRKEVKDFVANGLHSV
jgi:adenylate kinase family enzyme